MVKLVPTTLAEILVKPTVPPVVCSVRNIKLLAVTEVLATVAVPPTSVTEPSLEFTPVLICRPLPMVLMRRLPVETLTSPVNTGLASGAFRLLAVVTNAVVAMAVVLFPAV